jgi:hypothetical protein
VFATPMFARPRALVLALVLVGSLPACQRDQRAHPGATAARPGRPAIEFDERVHDFGVVNQDISLEHPFVIKNTGNAVLIIQNVRTSCGCTAATVGLTTIPPGGSSPLEVSMGTRFFSGPGSKTIQVESNDPLHPTSTLEIRYDIQRLLVLEPFYPLLYAKRGRNDVKKVWAGGSLVDQAELRVAKVESGGRRVLAKAIQERQEGKLRKGLALTLEGDSPGTDTGQVMVSTGLRNPAEVVVRFRATVEE